MTTPIRDYYEHAYDADHILHQQLRPAVPYAENSLWTYYARQLQQVIAQHNLEHANALEIGCGTGFLQEYVSNYVGVDIASSSGRFVYRPFVTGTADELPFRDNSFDLVWSIWVLEHIANPQKMLSEIRRVLKPNGILFLCAAWNVPSWVSQGYDVRPFRDFDWPDKLIKVSVIPRNTKIYRLTTTFAQRIWQYVQFRLHHRADVSFRRLRPNFEHYWSNDADAVTAIDAYTVWLWYKAQGDISLRKENTVRSLFVRHSEPLIFRVKPTT